MSRWLVERRLTDSSARLKRLRVEIQVAEEQLVSFTDDADEARMRALVSETPLAVQEHREAQRHLDSMTRHLGDLLAEVETLENAQNDLLDRLSRETA